MPKNYFKIVSTDLFLSFKNINEKSSTEFIGLIFGKISLLGYSGKYFNLFLYNLSV
jgi:hypothetical protein